MKLTTLTANGTARNTVNGNQRGLPTEALASRLNRSIEQTAQLMSESEATGVVESTKEGWRLSDEGERRFGFAFRTLSLPRDGLA